MSLIHHEKTQITLDTETGLMWQDNNDAKELRFNWAEAQEYCKNLRLGGFMDWEIPNEDILLDLANKAGNYGKEELRNSDEYSDYLTSTISNNEISVVSFLNKCLWSRSKNYSEYIRCVRNKILKPIEISEVFCFRRIGENSIILSSSQDELCFLKYDNKEYFGFFPEILEKINFSKIEDSANISEIINQKLKEKINEYLKVDEIQEPNFDLIMKDSFIKDEFETQSEFDERVKQFIEKQKKEYEQREIEYKKRVENLENIKKDFLFEIFAKTMGIPVLKDSFYDAETNDMYMTLFMTNCLWEKRIKVNIPNRSLAKDFKTKLSEVKVDVTFNLENEEFVFDKVELEFDNNKFIAEESKEQEKQEEIKIDFKLVTNEKDLGTSIDNQLPKYALEVKTLDNQKLEDEIQILKEKLQKSQDNNQNNEILKQEIEQLKESKLSLENIVRMKENEISYLKNTNEQIIKDNQVLNNQLINKNYEIEELKKYCNELQFNSSSQEEQTSSKVVERESFSNF